MSKKKIKYEDNDVKELKVAIIHYWLTGMRGGEKVLEQIIDIFPQAVIFTHVYDKTSVSKKINQQKIKTTFISKLPASKKLYNFYLPLMPFALEAIDLNDFDIIISSESGPAKGIIPSPNSLHICYCHSPMRYIWDLKHQYLLTSNFIKKFLVFLISHYLRIWDFASSSRVDFFVANSSLVKNRIKKFYRRDSNIIFPPVNIDNFFISDNKENFYLYVGQLAPYKRVDIAIEAFNLNGLPLVIIGEGSKLKSLEKKAKNNIKFLGHQSDINLKQYYSKSKALIFPGIEDFGIVPLEAMASGVPVIAYKAGGALDTIKENKTGIFFGKQTAESLNEAIYLLENKKISFDPHLIRDHANKFNYNNQTDKLRSFFLDKIKKHFNSSV